MSHINRCILRVFTKYGGFFIVCIMPKPMTSDLPFPTTDGICPEAFSMRIISPAYAASTGELNAILQYVYHSLQFKKQGYTKQADTLESIAIAEMYHLHLLGETICELGAAPVFTRYPPSGFDFYSAKYVSYSRTLANMLEDDILVERRAVCAYEKMLKQLKNDKVKAVIERILPDEKMHLEALEKMLSEFKSCN